MELTSEQNHAIELIEQWFENARQKRGPMTFYLGGYAGTGKTTIAKRAADGKGTVCFAAYTGKAASVLQSKGCPNALTVHKLIYKPKGDTNGADIARLQSFVHAGTASEAQIAELRELMNTNGALFEANGDAPIKVADLVVLDECSMISERMGKDLESFGVPILYLGDRAQLPPVMGRGHLAKRKCDFHLTEIHRQAADSKIIRLATQLRKGNFNALRYGDYGDVIIAPKKDIDWDFCAASGQIICGKHVTRKATNRVLRKRAGYTHILPESGDKLICRKNDHDKRLLNGVTCVATADSERFNMLATIYAEYEGRQVDDYTDPGKFEENYGERKSFPNGSNGLTVFDFGYAVTCHSSQGSQWDDLVVMDDRMQEQNFDFRKKWLYTAVTRAAERLTIYR